MPTFFVKCGNPAFSPGVLLGSISIGVIVLPFGRAELSDGEAGLAIAFKKAE